MQRINLTNKDTLFLELQGLPIIAKIKKLQN